jgi:hypothetical protein
MWNVEPFSKPFLVLLGAYKSFQIFIMSFLKRVNHVPRMRMEINKMNKQDEVVPSNV